MVGLAVVEPRCLPGNVKGAAALSRRPPAPLSLACADGLPCSHPTPLQSPGGGYQRHAPWRLWHRLEAERDLASPIIRLMSFRLSPCWPLHIKVQHVSEGTQSKIFVEHVEPQSVLARTCEGRPGVRNGDTIAQVDGLSGSSLDLQKRMEEIQKIGGLLNLVVVQRPLAFEVDLSHDEPLPQRLGIAVGIDREDPHHMIVLAIREEGLVPTWNVAHGTLRVCARDRITHVNGITHDIETMQAEIRNAAEINERLLLRIATPARDALQPDVAPLLTPRVIT